MICFTIQEPRFIMANISNTYYMGQGEDADDDAEGPLVDDLDDLEEVEGEEDDEEEEGGDKASDADDSE